MLYTKTQAKDFFGALRACSEEVLRYYKLPSDPGLKTRAWKESHAKGITFHYTAGVTWKESANWLNSASNKGSSCHFLALDRRIGELDHIVSKYPVLDVLPVLVLQLAELNRGTWHAGWVNGMNVGIENRNAGLVRRVGDHWCWWPNNWTTRFPAEGLGKTPVDIEGQWWEPFTYGQVVANVILGQMLYCLYEGDMDERWMLPHSATATSKMDAGKAFPLQQVRAAIVNQTLLQDLDWLQNYKADPMYMDDYEEEQDCGFLQQLAMMEGDLSLESEPVCPSVDGADLQLLVTPGPWKQELDAIRRALAKLWYVVSGSGEDYDEDTRLAVYIFQRSQDLEADSIPGDKTQAALMSRLKDFHLEV